MKAYRNTADLFLIVLFVILLALGLLAVQTLGVKAMPAGDNPMDYTVIRFGDCMADRATGDLYHTPNAYCLTGSEKPADVKHTKHETLAQADQSIDDGGITVTSDKPADKPADTTTVGNPGNDKPVGHAGEKCDKGMCENADGKTGEHGKSKND